MPLLSPPPHKACARADAAHVQAERLFAKIRQTVAGQAVPATLKSAFLEPVSGRLPSELSVEMFGRTDADFMAMFTGGCWCCRQGRGQSGAAVCSGLQNGRLLAAGAAPQLHNTGSALCSSRPRPTCVLSATAAGVLSALEAKRDALAKRTEGLIRCKEEFSALARCL